ncbi:hypothetical protein PV336_03150 [Streptomyces sp. MI02-2A]|uniref:hypothetical protein n=1 Tax=unclassified Streptomyces TaxID=2593676 RepID=UPI000741204F|nr:MULTISPECIES: hypothetical protein [unclassified Streptomyces]KUJ58058.1 hypothetical protein ADL25_03825 [Streptomyces sp. NRRL F-5122]MDX3258233.1 hypothetical protein [Streptomyces sp. MI02-2A]
MAHGELEQTVTQVSTAGSSWQRIASTTVQSKRPGSGSTWLQYTWTRASPAPSPRVSGTKLSGAPNMP